MTRDDATGVWSVVGTPAWKGRYYLYEVEVWQPATMQVETNLVTDPYSLTLSTNSQRSQIVDLADPALAPAGWSSLVKPRARRARGHRPLRAARPRLLGERPDRPRRPARHLQGVHGRVVERHEAPEVACERRTHARPSAPGVRLRHHRRGQVELAAAAGQLVELPPRLRKQQSCVMSVAGSDGFNWGYDPWHYTVPEGSYATNPDGSARIVEFRQMVQSLNDIGLRTVMDVVYNHTNAVRPERQVGARPHRARLLPPPRRRRQRRDQHLLPEHRARARHDGEAARRLGRDLGEVLQGRRIPLRPHGPPHEARTCSPFATHSTPSRSQRTAWTARRSTSTARAGTSARSRTTRGSSRRAR